MDRTIVNSSSCKKRKLKQTFRVLFRGWLAGQLEKRFPTDKKDNLVISPCYIRNL